jgi:hypothetical protein
VAASTCTAVLPWPSLHMSVAGCVAVHGYAPVGVGGTVLGFELRV